MIAKIGCVQKESRVKWDVRMGWNLVDECLHVKWSHQYSTRTRVLHECGNDGEVVE